MATRIVMVNGDRFAVDIDVNRAANDILSSPDRHVLIEPTGGMRAYLNPAHIAYVQAVSEEPMVSVVD